MSANQATAFQVHALGGYTGPGAVTVQVYDGATLQDPHGQTATVTIPVQVGPDAPVLRCPADPLQVVEGGAPAAYDIGQLCHVWVDTTVATSPAPLHRRLGQAGGRGQRQRARRHQPPADRRERRRARAAPGRCWSCPAGRDRRRGTLNVAVIKAPLPDGGPVSVTVEAGQSVTVDLSQYVTSPLAQPDIQVLGVTHPAGRDGDEQRLDGHDHAGAGHRTARSAWSRP